MCSSDLAMRKAVQASKEPSKDKTSPSRSAAPEPAKRKRKFPFRKVADLEAEIADVEAKLADLQRQLVDPDVYRDGRRAHEVSQQIEQTQSKLAGLIEHWEEAMELNPAS